MNKKLEKHVKEVAFFEQAGVLNCNLFLVAGGTIVSQVDAKKKNAKEKALAEASASAMEYLQIK